ncbi:MAG: hypothetical protein V3573_09415 [Desulfovibrionaceae bacterium]
MQYEPSFFAAAWRRHQNLWNWSAQALGLGLLCLALWLRSQTLAWIGLILIGSGLLDFRLAPPTHPAWLLRLIRAEVVWVNKPWDRRKRLEAFVAGLASVVALGIFWTGSLAGLGLAAGVCALLWARAGNKNAGLDP